jgi:hypothetical protein
MMAEYKNPSPIGRDEAEKIFANGIPEQICDALVAVAFHDKDWKWSQIQCLRFLSHTNPSVSGLAATCLGHIARIHHMLDRDLVVDALRNRLQDPEIGGRVEDALSDIEVFID